MAQLARQLVEALEGLLGVPVPLRVQVWDGSTAGPPGAPTVVLRNRRALRRLLWQPGELGLARAYVAGDLEVAPGTDLYEVLTAVAHFSERPEIRLLRLGPGDVLGPKGRAGLRALLRAGALGPQPIPPPEEAGAVQGRLHSRSRDRAAISHHYDVGNDFYGLVLGPSMVYSCAYWEPAAKSLEAAQEAKLDLICRKLGLRPGMRLLDVGCGWGSLVLHAAGHYGVTAVGVSISEEQVALARRRVEEAGLADRVEIRLQDYREVPDGPFDAISSVGMAEHVGTEQYRVYAAGLYRLLVPGGRLLNHQIARRPNHPGEPYRPSPFIDRYVFPDGELSPVGSTVARLEEAGFEVRDVESLREHYGLTLREWVANLEVRWTEAVRLVGRGRARVWRLYMAASALAFEENRIGVNQILAVRTGPEGAARLPATREEWLLRPATTPHQQTPAASPAGPDFGDRPSVR
ncbi:cyclopropane-fatty-acyl-phospholipid synthase family protein [Streptomyces sp. CB01881]|uniref:SAM-dependent methyltransferase n=1 Tax=Streptomyces sp. CB01881 TaxID=2078691 RepID=UPI000CDC3C85|nr:cyclopropane-fatty-acyl-phospholipid synthase family protein [Streptomyces sp. CB01881]AUY50741.1 SAM-dependent methyltransferase [Streptomyces sp. CB01881]TYC74127.1 class I SAM-dependent methyltransferase [Streptomyces sp. CB01881]